MKDEVIEFLKKAWSLLNEEPMKSRESALTMTKIDEAILWRQKDLDRVKHDKFYPYPDDSETVSMT